MPEETYTITSGMVCRIKNRRCIFMNTYRTVDLARMFSVHEHHLHVCMKGKRFQKQKDAERLQDFGAHVSSRFRCKGGPAGGGPAERLKNRQSPPSFRLPHQGFLTVTATQQQHYHRDQVEQEIKHAGGCQDMQGATGRYCSKEPCTGNNGNRPYTRKEAASILGAHIDTLRTGN